MFHNARGFFKQKAGTMQDEELQAAATTYTVYDRFTGEVYSRGLKAVQAMQEILTRPFHPNDNEGGYSGTDIPQRGSETFEIRPTNENANLHSFDLWCDGCLTVVFSVQTDRDRATEEIARKVIAASWPHSPHAMTDAAFERLRAMN